MRLGCKVFSEISVLDGNIGFYFKDLTDGETLEINENRLFSAASTIKIPLTLYIIELVQKNKFKLTDKIILHEKNRVGGTGVIQNLNLDYVPTLGELVLLALSVSDNVATNELIDLAGGYDGVNEYSLKNGAKNTSLQRKMLDLDARKQGKDNWTTAYDMGIFLEKIALTIYKGTPSEKANILPIFKGMVMQQCRNKLPAKIPAFDYYGLKNGFIPDEGVLVANKTGDLWTTQNDIGIFVLPSGKFYILSICTDDLQVAQNGIEMISLLSKSVYEYMLQKY